MYKWWDALLSRSKAMDLLEGKDADAPVHPMGQTAGQDVDVGVLRDMVSAEDRDVIKRF